jgi:hypothetical protein
MPASLSGLRMTNTATILPGPMPSNLPRHDDTDAAYPALREQFNETEIAKLVMSLPRSGVETF